MALARGTEIITPQRMPDQGVFFFFWRVTRYVGNKRQEFLDDPRAVKAPRLFLVISSSAHGIIALAKWRRECRDEGTGIRLRSSPDLGMVFHDTNE